MSSTEAYRVQITGNELVGDHAIYFFSVESPDGKKWELQYRYSEIRNFHEAIKNSYPVNSLKAFPSKKFFGRTTKKFLNERQGELQVYFTRLLSIDPKCKERQLQKFFQFHKNGQISAEKEEADTQETPAATEDVAEVSKQTAEVSAKKTIESILNHSSNLMIDLSRSIRYAADHAIIRSRTQRHMKVLNSPYSSIFPCGSDDKTFVRPPGGPSNQGEQQHQVNVLNAPLDASVFSISQPPTAKSLVCPSNYDSGNAHFPYQLFGTDKENITAYIANLDDFFAHSHSDKFKGFIVSFDTIAAEAAA